MGDAGEGCKARSNSEIDWAVEKKERDKLEFEWLMSPPKRIYLGGKEIKI